MKKIFILVKHLVITPAIIVSTFCLFQKGVLDSSFEKVVVFAGLSLLINCYLDNVREILK